MSISRTLEVPGYRVVQLLGSGARSTIWQIRDCESDELFSLKRVVKRDPSDGCFLAQAINEYNVASQLDHPTLRSVISIRRIRRWLSLREIHLVMGFCEGKTLQDNRPESVSEIIRIFTEVGQAIAYMNAHGFVHADLKPNNIIVSPSGKVNLIDLGQSCPIGTVKPRIQGTPDFIAPEQVNRRPLDGRTDVFNFAAALYWALTGKAIPTILPKAGEVTKMNDLSIIPPEQINSSVPPALSKLILDCLETQPFNRPESMNAVVSRLKLLGNTLGKNNKRQ